jgi:glucosamine-6-phosphate deaminase
VPTKALTMGIGTILNAKKIVILANGAAKHEAVAKMLAGKLDTSCPASMLNLHRDVTVICDELAYQG